MAQVAFVDKAGGTATVSTRKGGEWTQRADYAHAPFFEWARDPRHRGEVAVVDATLPAGAWQRPLSLLMVTPHVHPGTPPEFDGVLVFVLDAPALARRFTAAARSGTTGYAWVIDGRGIFLAHPMSDFIGKNAFTVRRQKDPHLGFEGINVIMREFMLRGEEGMGEYESGWHRDLVGPVRKLIAYSPVRLEFAGQPPLLWSVAVAAPASEVQGMVHSLFLRQLWVQGTIVLALLVGGLSLWRIERYWTAVQKEKEQQINRSARLASLGTLAAGVAHEINNPIAIILGFADLLLEKTPPGTEAYEQLRIIDRQATACKTIVENLRSFGRAPKGAVETVDVNDELRRLLDIVRNTLLTEKVRCAVTLQEPLPPARCDPHGLQQVLLNLITNARGAMKNGGTLKVRTRQADDRVVIEIGDTGHGIPRKHLERIFDPFFTTKAPGEGTGLGLSISHGIVEKAGGTITVESRDEDEVGAERSGTTFRVILPAAVEPAPHETLAGAPV